MHVFKRQQRIPTDIETAWGFFSDPKKLQAITPENLGFTILSLDLNPIIYAGQLIEYRVKPFLGISMYWMTEITHVASLNYFIDEQRFGPYRFWHHQHHFRSIDGGVEMTDIVHYSIPLGILGRLVDRLFVQSSLKKIFDFRYRKIEDFFGTWQSK